MVLAVAGFGKLQFQQPRQLRGLRRNGCSRQSTVLESYSTPYGLETNFVFVSTVRDDDLHASICVLQRHAYRADYTTTTSTTLLPSWTSRRVRHRLIRQIVSVSYAQTTATTDSMASPTGFPVDTVCATVTATPQQHQRTQRDTQTFPRRAYATVLLAVDADCCDVGNNADYVDAFLCDFPTMCTARTTMMTTMTTTTMLAPVITTTPKLT